MQLGLSYPKFYIYDSTNTTLVETITLQRFVGNTHGAAQNGEYITNISPFSGVRKQTFKGYRINDSIKVFSPERWATILSYQASVNNDDVEPDTSKAIRIVDYCNSGYTIRYVPHVDLEDVYGYTYSLVHVTISDFGYGLRSHSDQITINVVGVSRDTYWTPFRKFDMVNCIDCDGVNDYVSLSNKNILKTHSFELFIKFDTISIAIFFGSTVSGDYFGITSTNAVYQAGGVSVVFSYSFSVGVKYHFFVIRSGTSVSLYVNGGIVDTKTLSANNDFNVLQLCNYGGSNWVDGKLSNFRIYQSGTITSTQVKNQYASGYGNYPLDLSMYLMYEFDNTGGTSTSETDQSGGGSTGTLNNGVTRTTW